MKLYEKKSKTTMINLINLLFEIWDRDNSTIKKTQQTMKLEA
jgi:hypothetical protein